jgi:hypothetical protein
MSYVKKVIDKKPNQFKEEVIKGLQERIISKLEVKRQEFGANLFKEGKDEDEEKDSEMMDDDSEMMDDDE